MIAPAQKPRPTAADILAAAISPLFIMFLVGSFVFFLLELVYGGPYAGRLRWTLFWFVFAMVLVSRISVEEGFAKASLYGVALAWATAMWIFRFVDFVFGVLTFLAFIWWCASKLVWDVTVIPDDDDSSGEGLMAVAGFAIPGEAETKLHSTLVPWWKRLFKNESERPGVPHAPGLWVIYFSIVALPFFGLGYALIPAKNSAQRATSFHYLWLFVISALSLLLISSFLGLRRYLRQRYLSMPLVLTRKWFQSGIAMMLLILLGAIALPRPEGTYQLTGVWHAISSPEQRASQNAKLDSDPEKGLGNEKSKGGSDDAKTDSSKANNPSQSSAAGGGRNSGHGQGFQKKIPPTVPTTSTLSLMQILIQSLLVLFAFYLLIRYWRVILDFLRSVFSDFKLSAKKTSTTKAIAQRPAVPKRKFSSFTNPFTNGDATRIAPRELVIQSFEALEAWARDHGFPRGGFATPIEFGETLSHHFFTMERDLKETTHAYSQLAYGDVTPAPDVLIPLERLWASMSTSIKT